MGSTSMQIAFEPSNQTIPSSYSEEVILKNKKHLIYAQSYLCLGKSEFVRRYYAALTKVRLNLPCGGVQLEKKD